MFDLSKLGAGGPILAVLAVLSLISVALIVVKTLRLWSVTAGGSSRDDALAHWAEGRQDAARDALSDRPADRVLDHAMSALSQGVTGAPLIAELTRLGNEEFATMSRGLRVLELIAMISPLLGLLGTVTGMIQSFQELELAEGAANASVLAGGIWQALLTTAAGLLVAIPAAVGASLLAGRAERGAQVIENAVGRLLQIEERASR